MGFLSKFTTKSRDKPNGNIPTGKMTSAWNWLQSNLSPYRSRTGDVLKTLRSINEETQAIEYLKRVNPDVSMAVWNFVRLANQGHEIKFYSLDGKGEILSLKDEWRDFAARINEISSSGLDGLIDQWHKSFYLLGAMGSEVEVTKDRKDIYDVYAIKPTTIEWELKEINGRKVYVPFQYTTNGGKIYLDRQHANFYWIPADPDIGDPRGTLTLSPVLQAIDFQMQILQDLQAVLHHQGYPKNDIELDIEKLHNLCPANIKNDPVKWMEYIDKNISNLRANLENMAPDSDYIHTNDSKINQANGNAATRSLDVRAINELVDTQTLSGLKQMAIFMNRNTGVTESWGTVQFKIYCSGIESCQRASKRMVEEIARLWLRVKGVQAKPVFTHNVVDWNSEEQRETVKLMKQEFYVIAQLMGWISGDEASQEIMGVEKAVGTPNENIRISFSKGGAKSDNDKYQKQRGNTSER